MEKEKLIQEAADKKFQNFVLKQEQTLRVSIYLLLNLSEDLKVFFERGINIMIMIFLIIQRLRL
jgi:hypothetical protein